MSGNTNGTSPNGVEDAEHDESDDDDKEDDAAPAEASAEGGSSPFKAPARQCNV